MPDFKIEDKFAKVYLFLIDKLRRELPLSLTYHNVEHTIEVIIATKEISGKENVSIADTEILTTAALFHDAGFLNGCEDHEEKSCQLARSVLPDFGYGREEIAKICALILATKMPQKPQNRLEEILCDADLHYLGTDRYFLIANRLYLEQKKLGIIKSWGNWQKIQKQFLMEHQFFTPCAIKLWSSRQAYNLQLVKQKRGLDEISMKHGTRNKIFQDVLFMISGIVAAGFGLKGFLVPNNFFDGGVTGLSLLLHDLYHFNLAYIIILLNLPLIVFSYFSVSRQFAYRTFFCVLLLGIALLFLPYPIITSDKLLISLFGGFFVGMGIGLTMRAGCALDGVEVLALYTLKKTSFTITEIILGINVFIFCIAAFKFGIETALYSILTYFTASRTIDYVVEGIEAFTGVTIISAKSELIKYQLVNELGRGITIYKGERGFLPGNFEIRSDCDIIFTLATRLEMRKLKNLVAEIDPNAFIVASTVREASGGILSRKTIHH
ncbi:MAG: hypothetical protein NVSMB67_18720 [Flavisolibacter sp.]